MEKEPKIIFSGDEAVVVYKPEGWLTVGRNKNWPSLEEWAANNVEGTSEVNRSGIVHRLDRETSGGVLVATSPRAWEYYSRQFKEKKVIKYYWCLVSGRTTSWGKIDMPLTILRRGGVVKRKVGAEGKMASSEFWQEQVGCKDGRQYSWLKVRIYTGRTHQIRVHLAYMGWPIVGDRWYGKEKETRLMLHEGYIGLMSIKGNQMGVDIPLPENLNKILEEYEIRI